MRVEGGCVNFVRIADAKSIILMGAGDAFVGILYLLANRGRLYWGLSLRLQVSEG